MSVVERGEPHGRRRGQPLPGSAWPKRLSIGKNAARPHGIAWLPSPHAMPSACPGQQLDQTHPFALLDPPDVGEGVKVHSGPHLGDEPIP